MVIQVAETRFVENILKELNYDIIKYDAGDIRNKSIIEMITMHNMSDTNVLSLLQTYLTYCNNNG